MVIENHVVLRCLNDITEFSNQVGTPEISELT